MREEYTIAPGKIVVRGKLHARDAAKAADYVLFLKPGLPLAVVEAKDNNHGLGAGMQQAQGYADRLDVPFVLRYSVPSIRIVRDARTSAPAGVSDSVSSAASAWAKVWRASSSKLARRSARFRASPSPVAPGTSPGTSSRRHPARTAAPATVARCHPACAACAVRAAWASCEAAPGVLLGWTGGSRVRLLRICFVDDFRVSPAKK